MRRLLACTVGFLLLASCTEVSDPSILDDQPVEEEGLSLPATFEIFDGTSGSAGANPHFFFLPPLAPTTPAFAGVAVVDEEPTVTVCHFESWDDTAETCGSALVTFSTEPDQFGNAIVVGPGGKYRVRWDTDEYEVDARDRFRVSVSLGVQALGWVDVKAYKKTNSRHFDPQGNIALSTTGELNIVFRIEEGALEHEYCDVSGIEDCDVEIFQYDEAGCLRVFENPGQTGELLGSQACVPANAAKLNGAPVPGEYAVILTLEDNSVQGGAVPTNLQVPFFPDLKTDPRFQKRDVRKQNRKALTLLLEAKLIQRGTQEWVELLNANGVPSGAILSLEDALKQPQIEHRETLKDVPIEGIGTVPLFTLTAKFDQTPGDITSPPPRLSAHTAEVLAGIGIAEDELADLKAKHVI